MWSYVVEETGEPGKSTLVLLFWFLMTSDGIDVMYFLMVVRMASCQTKSKYFFITKTRPCNIQRFFTAVKMIIFR